MYIEEPVGNTCPLLNDLFSLIESFLGDNTYEITRAYRLIEEIRSANFDLRMWGRDLAKDLNDAQQQLNDIEEVNRDLLRKVKYLEQLLANQGVTKNSGRGRVPQHTRPPSVGLDHF